MAIEKNNRPPEISSEMFEYQTNWRMKDKISVIRDNPTSPLYPTLQGLVRDIRLYLEKCKELEIQEKEIKEERLHLAYSQSSLVQSAITLLEAVGLMHDDSEEKQDNFEFSLAATSDEMVELWDQIRGRFRELDLIWYLRDQDNTQIWFKPSTIFFSAMQQINELCKNIE